MIKIIFKSARPCIEVALDGRAVSYVTESDYVISFDVEFGIHQLEITSTSDQRVVIEKVLVGDCDSHKLLYLSWSTDCNQQKFQPCTELWQKDMTWTLPFMFPMSNWITSVEKKFNNGSFGKNLLQDYVCYYPESIQLDNNMPSVVKDFYQYNFDFTAIPRNNPDPTLIPFMKYNRDVPHYLIDDIRTEIHNQSELIANIIELTNSSKVNLTEFNMSESEVWKVCWLYKLSAIDMTTVVSRLDQFPAIQKLVDFLQLDIFHCFIGFLPPGQFIYPHMDDMSRSHVENYKKYQGCTQLYIPIDWPLGSSLKLADAGIVPIDKDPVVINTDYFTHAAVNTSNQNRIVLAIRTSQEILKDCTFYK